MELLSKAAPSDAGLCGFKHAGRRREPNRRGDYGPSAQRQTGRSRTAGKLYPDVTGCSLDRKTAQARRTLGIALLLLGTAAGAPFLSKLAGLPRAILPLRWA